MGSGKGFHIYSLEELFAVEEAQRSRQWSGEEVEALAEHNYRRGYTDGWIEAVNALGVMMFEQRVSRDKAHAAVFDHWQGLLAEWRQKTADLMIDGHPCLLYGARRDTPYELGGDWPPKIG